MVVPARCLFVFILVLSLLGTTTLFQRTILLSLYEDYAYGTADLPTTISTTTAVVVVTTAGVATTNGTAATEELAAVAVATTAATRRKASTAVVVSSNDKTQLSHATTPPSTAVVVDDVPILTTTTRKKRLKIIHVMNIYAIPVPGQTKDSDNDTDDSDNNSTTSRQRYMSPFDQWVTLKSVERALQHLRSTTTTTTSDVDVDIDVEFVCAMFDSDYQNYFQHPEHQQEFVPCQHHPLLLKRSTKTEYQHLLPSPIQELPFLQELLDVGMAVGAASATPEYSTITTTTGMNRNHNKTDVLHQQETDFFVMITNSDIGLTKHFYSQLRSKLQHHDAISINRMTIPDTDVNITKLKRAYYHKYDNHNATLHSDDDNASTSATVLSSLFTKIEETLIPKGKKHMGWDCFLMHSSIVQQRLHLGELFAGYPPWGKVVHHLLTLPYVATNYTNYKSYKLASEGGTFHIGSSARKWLAHSPSRHHNNNNNNNHKRRKHTKTETTMKTTPLKAKTTLSSSSLSLSLTQQQQTTTRSATNQNEDHTKNMIHQLALHLWEKKCPLFSATGSSSEPYSFINTANCGRLYSTTTPMTSVLIQNNTNDTNTTVMMGSSTDNNNNRTYYQKTIENGTATRTTYRNIPHFIRAGYEEFYLQQQQQQYQQQQQSKEDGQGESKDKNWLLIKQWNISTASKHVDMVSSSSLSSSSSSLSLSSSSMEKENEPNRYQNKNMISSTVE